MWADFAGFRHKAVLQASTPLVHYTNNRLHVVLSGCSKEYLVLSGAAHVGIPPPVLRCCEAIDWPSERAQSLNRAKPRWPSVEDTGVLPVSRVLEGLALSKLKGPPTRHSGLILLAVSSFYDMTSCLVILKTRKVLGMLSFAANIRFFVCLFVAVL